MVHTLRLDNYYPTPRKLVLGTNSSYGTESIKIERGAGWDELNLTATWHIPGREEPLRVALLDGDAMDVPPEVTKEAKDGVLVLAGLASGVQRASCNVEYLILEQAGVYGGADAEPTPELAAQVLEAALQAKADAEAAAEDAAAAKANADKAQADAEKAKQAAENAAADAAKAGPYAEAARAAQEAAESARDEAIAAQQAAENAASAAAASKSAADTLAAEAARAAQAAENFKAAANNAANFAGKNATAAQQAAGTATASANDAGQSASDAAASKAAAETAAKAAQDAQTAAAAAKAEAVNAQTAAQAAAKKAQDAKSAAEKARDNAQTAQKGAEAARDTAAKSAEAAAKSEANAKQSADTLAESVENVVANTAAVAELKKKKAEIDDTALGANAWSSKHIIDMLCPPLEESGNPVVCYPVAGYPLGVKAKWEPAQEGTGTPSPENIRPIKGRDSVTVERCGENLLNLSPENIENGAYENGEKVDGVDHQQRTLQPIKIEPGQYLIFTTFYSIKLNARATFLTSDSEYLSNTMLSYNTPTKIPEKARFLLLHSSTEGFTGTNPMLIIGTTSPTTYTPYNGQTNTLTLPKTVYGGELDAVSGGGKETWKMLTLDGTEKWDKYGNVSEKAGASCFYFSIDDKDIGYGTSVCNKFVNTKNRNPFDSVSMKKFTYTDHPNIKNIYMNYGDDQTVPLDEWKAYLAAQNDAGTPVQIAYKLAKPVPFTATGGTALPALAGVNTVLTDADSATVTGRADPIKRITDLEDAVASIN